MKHKLKNGRSVDVRLLQTGDNEKLFEYFDKHFSKESKSRFAKQLPSIRNPAINSLLQSGMMEKIIMTW